jgi:RNA polymerase sigma-70 factor, ECF subfamily
MTTPLAITEECPAESNDEGLIRAAAAGDHYAFGELYSKYARMVHGILLARVPPSEAEDLVQDVFVSALKKLRLLRSAAAFQGWLCAIARNRAMDYFRQTRQYAPLDDQILDCHAAAANHDGAYVLEAIRSLPEAYRETLTLRLVEGMTGPEIARQTGLRPESVRVNLCRGFKMLRQILEGVR